MLFPWPATSRLHHVGLDSLGLEIKVRIGIFLVHHIQVALQNDTRPIFPAWGRRLANNDIAGTIDHCFQAQSLTELLHEFDDPFFIFGGSGNCIQTFKMFPEHAGFVGDQGFVHGNFP